MQIHSAQMWEKYDCDDKSFPYELARANICRLRQGEKKNTTTPQGWTFKNWHFPYIHVRYLFIIDDWTVHKHNPRIG